LQFNLEIRLVSCKRFSCNLVLPPGYISNAICDSQAKHWRSLPSLFSHGIEPTNPLHPTESTTPTVPSILNVQISEKLTKSNYLLWSAQVLPALHAAQLQDLLTSIKMTPTKEITTMVDDKPVKQIIPRILRGLPEIRSSLATNCRHSPMRC
jgi:hypothetical protein